MKQITSKGLSMALVTIVCLGAVACAAPSGVTSSPVPTSTVTSSSQIELPLEDYLAPAADRELVQRAISKLQADCAARFGVEAPPFELDVSAIRAEFGLDRRYGLVNRAEVEIHGYEPGPSGSGSSEQRRSDSTSTLIDEVLSGVTPQGEPSELMDSTGRPMPEGGCAKEGWASIARGVPFNPIGLPLQLLEEARLRMTADSRYQAAEADWADCMAEAGHDFEHLYEAGDSLVQASQEVKRDMALLEVDCSLEVNFPGRAMAVDAEHQLQLIAEHDRELREVVEWNRKLVDNAEAALG